MSRHFASPSEPWFKIRNLEVTTVILVALVGVASGLAAVISPALPQVLYFHPSLVAEGQLWRVVTWPLANSIWVVITALILWYFGSDLERTLGRTRMAWLLVGAWASLTVASTLVSLLPSLGGSSLAGLDLIQFAVLLLWIAEYPKRPFLFGIPAWVFGAVISAVQVLGLVANRAFGALLSLLLGLVFVAIAARRFGLLDAYAWIPGRGGVRPAAPARTRPAPPRSRVRRDGQRLSDRERLDALLDQINERGIGSLSESQRRELMRLRDRLRGS